MICRNATFDIDQMHNVMAHLYLEDLSSCSSAWRKIVDRGFAMAAKTPSFSGPYAHNCRNKENNNTDDSV